ncbi:hypothetical protein [Rhodopirellula sp. MGV]|uniref:hypothetical protein n=1 Tax=Rhodopirellula sp. MGV TaxID=2023130 RepID=UPI00117AD9B5|nr:hypothetical protein [Rhodopirellula sp. MGV]
MRRSIFGPIVSFLAVIVFIAGCGLIALLYQSSEVSGTASLPNGGTAVINGPFSCSANSPSTEIEAGGHSFVFSPTTIFIDGVSVAPLDATVTSVEIDSSFWTATLRVNGSEVPMKR